MKSKPLATSLKHFKKKKKQTQISILINSEHALTEAFTQVRNMNGIARTPSLTSLHKSKVRRS